MLVRLFSNPGVFGHFAREFLSKTLKIGLFEKRFLSIELHRVVLVY